MRRLLIIDDNNDLLFAMQRLLSFYNFSVRTITGSKDLLNEITSFKPEIIIIDVLLTGEDGRLICKALREDMRNREVTLILFSASPFHLENYQQYKADGVIEKPFEVKELIDRIEISIQSRRDFFSRIRGI